MKATELKIGDWVLDGKEPAQITGIMCDDLFETTFSPSVGGDCLSPIPLTPEILVKNGFENDFYHDESVADYHFVRLEGYSYREDFILVTWCNGELNVVNDLIGEVEIHCENVHELQHALRLCGIDKEIEIL